jgi:hypothetical protein
LEELIVGLKRCLAGAAKLFSPQRPDIEHPVRGSVQLDDSPAVCLTAGKVQVGHFADGVTNGFVNGAFRGLSAVNIHNI